MQGIDFGPDGTLYASEQGPKTDDEVNVLVGGDNYGWPHVVGFKDDKAYQMAPLGPRHHALRPADLLRHHHRPIGAVEDETSWPDQQHDPLTTLFTVPSDWDFTDPACGGIDFICWPTVATLVDAGLLPQGGRGHSRLGELAPRHHAEARLDLPRATQRRRQIRRRADRALLQSENRLRDMALSPDMKTMYVRPMSAASSAP
jgi:hypothetical protein